MRSKYSIPFLFFLFSTLSVAQNDIGSWLIYKNKLKLNSKTSIDTQHQHRSFTLDFEEDQALFTAGMSHTLLENLKVSAGYRKIGALSEHGMYQRIAFSTQLHKVKLINSFFLEERWLGESFQLRYRFGLTAKIPLSTKTALSLTEEVFLQNSGTSFNQNRVTAQVSHKLSDVLQLNSGIMHWQFPSLKRWVFLLSVSHTINI